MSTPSSSLLRKSSQYLIGLIGAAYLHAVGKTSFEIRVDDPASLFIRRTKAPCIYAFWHNNQALLAYAHRGEKASVLVSRSKDGEYVARVMANLGLHAIRGSSTRGGAVAFLEMLEWLKAGRQVGITPDGPKGPVYSVKSGILEAALKGNVPIVPTAVKSRREFVFRSWDRFSLPLPFGVNVVAHGKPFYLSPDSSEEAMAEKVRTAINAIKTRAVEADFNTPSWGALLLERILFAAYSVLSSVLFPFIGVLLFVRFGFKRGFLDLEERFRLNKKFSCAGAPLWCHCASMGEWQALKPLLSQLEAVGESAFLVTTSAPEVKRLIKKERPAIFVQLLPVDQTFVVRRFLKKLNPKALLLVETELWPVLLSSCLDRFIPVFVVNGRLSHKSVRLWQVLRPLSMRMMRCLSWIGCRNADDAAHFKAVGATPENVEVAGNLKYDALDIADHQKRNDYRRKIMGSAADLVIAGGSTWPGEEAMLLRGLEASKSGCRLLLAPRRMERIGEIEALLKVFGLSYERWSQIKDKALWTAPVLLVDTLGDLKHLYQAADVCFVGGSFYPKGGQNPLEPAAAGALPLVGPSMGNFKAEAACLLKNKGAFSFESEQDLLSKISLLANDRLLLETMSLAAQQTVKSEKGASQKTALRLSRLLALEPA